MNTNFQKTGGQPLRHPSAGAVCETISCRHTTDRPPADWNFTCLWNADEVFLIKDESFSPNRRRWWCWSASCCRPLSLTCRWSIPTSSCCAMPSSSKVLLCLGLVLGAFDQNSVLTNTWTYVNQFGADGETMLLFRWQEQGTETGSDGLDLCEWQVSSETSTATNTHYIYFSFIHCFPQNLILVVKNSWGNPKILKGLYSNEAFVAQWPYLNSVDLLHARC